MKKIIILLFAIIIASVSAFANPVFEKDIIKTSEGDLEITFIGHASMMMKWHEKIIHIDPYSALADYNGLPKADLILITHHHRDHLDEKAINSIKTDKTEFILAEMCFNQLKYGKVMKNGDNTVYENVKIEAIPAYNIVHKRDTGELYHPKGEGNGYILTFGDKRVLIGGDTENTSEIKALEKIDYAFLPMNLPFTMTPEMVADAVKAFKPKVLYPYHYSNTDPNKLLELLKDIEIRIRKMQ
ncbi:MAG: MBL fold metallo-hydrolase [Desulfobacterales bacterium]|nr:MBL fold metallo-hydrolase [Desulfobacterales bacterium]